MPKILFIQPTQYGTDGTLCKQNRIYLPGLVFPLLAAMTPSHWEVEVKIEVVDDIDFDADVDLVGIGTMGYATLRGLHIAREFRARGKTVVMGGYMASLMVDYVRSHVDAVVVGDAEISYPRLLEDFERTGRLKPVYDDPVTSLEGLPVPRYELLLEKKIGGMLPVQAGRGCPHSCSFCSIACIYKGLYMTRPVEEVLRDIEAIRGLGVRRFYLIDDNIISNPRYLEELCEAIEPLKMPWATQCSLELARYPDLLERVRRAGAEMMSFGVESITQDGLDRLNKKWLRVDRHEESIQKISDAGIMVSSEMMIGTDSDTEESIRATYDFVNRLRIPVPRFYILTPMPGTPLYEELRAAGRLVTDDLTQYSGAKCVHRPAKMSPERLTEAYWWLYGEVFRFGCILRRTLFHPGMLRRPLVFLFAFFVNLHYRRYVRKRVPPNIF
ncbi:MAG: B12-binding domain-containing radical SAM protein [Bacteroidetes bacterium]|nr:B12-binding domain-containing radical SAM protein [Bacteroidota bacterium]